MRKSQRQHKRRSYVLYPHKEASFKSKRFDKLTELKKYLFAQGDDALSASISINRYNYSGSSHGGIQLWCSSDKHGRLVLRKVAFDKRAYKLNKVSKSTKRYYYFLDKFIKVMSKQSDDKFDIEKDLDRQLLKILVLFRKMHVKFLDITEYDEYTKEVVEGYLERDTIESLSANFWYWSDRCHFARKQAIVALIRRDRPHVYEQWLNLYKSGSNNLKRRFRL